MPVPFVPRYEAVPHLTQRTIWSDEPGVLTGIGDACLGQYLTDPNQCAGCLAHADPDCLCDVDVSRTAGIDFDQVPDVLFGVADSEDLLRAAALIWMRYDVCGGQYPSMLHHDGHLYAMSEEDLDAVVAEIRAGAQYKDLKDRYTLTSNEFAFIRRALQLSRPYGAGRALADKNEAKILGMHADGLSVPEIKRALEAEGLFIGDKSLRRFMERRSLTPNPGDTHKRVERAVA